MADQSFLPFFQFNDIGTGGVDTFDPVYISKFVDITFDITAFDQTTGDYSADRVGLRPCTKEDFKNDMKAFDLFNARAPDSTICPEDLSKLKFEGNLNQPKVSIIALRIAECMQNCEEDPD